MITTSPIRLSTWRCAAIPWRLRSRPANGRSKSVERQLTHCGMDARYSVLERAPDAVRVADSAIQSALEQGVVVDLELYELHADSLLRTGQAESASAVTRTAIDLAVGNRRMLARLYGLLAAAEQAQGHIRAAQNARLRAHEYAPRR